MKSKGIYLSTGAASVPVGSIASDGTSRTTRLGDD
jgi:hypothetical protein